MVEGLEHIVALLRGLERSGLFHPDEVDTIREARWVIADELLSQRERQEAEDAHGQRSAI